MERKWTTLSFFFFWKKTTSLPAFKVLSLSFFYRFQHVVVVVESFHKIEIFIITRLHSLACTATSSWSQNDAVVSVCQTLVWVSFVSLWTDGCCSYQLCIILSYQEENGIGSGLVELFVHQGSREREEVRFSSSHGNGRGERKAMSVSRARSTCVLNL